MSRWFFGLVACLTLSAVLGAELFFPSSTDVAVDPPTRRVSPPPGIAAPAADRHREWAVTALARPLFSRSRRPPPSAAGPVVAADGLPRLTGILVTGAVRHAIFASASDGRPSVAAEGSQVGAYRVQSIEVGKVTVAGPEGLVSLRPSFAAAARRAPPTGAGSPPDAPKPSLLDRLRSAASRSIGIPGGTPGQPATDTPAADEPAEPEAAR